MAASVPWLVAFLATICSTALHAGNLEQPDSVDLVQVLAGSGQLQLLVILGDDRVDSRPALRALYTKVYHYQRYIASGQALRDAPTANARIRPSVVVHAPVEATTAEMQNLAGLKLDFNRRGAELDIEPHAAGLTARPRAFTLP